MTEREELAALIDQVALAWEPDVCLLGNMTAAQLARAAALLREARPQPVPVAQRLPGPEDCDAEGRVWVCERDRDMAPQWNLLRSKCASTNYGTTHWLPHWAVPIPTEPAETPQ